MLSPRILSFIRMMLIAGAIVGIALPSEVLASCVCCSGSDEGKSCCSSSNSTPQSSCCSTSGCCQVEKIKKCSSSCNNPECDSSCESTRHEEHHCQCRAVPVPAVPSERSLESDEKLTKLQAASLDSCVASPVALDYSNLAEEDHTEHICGSLRLHSVLSVWLN